MIGTSGIRLLVDEKVDYSKINQPCPNIHNFYSRTIRAIHKLGSIQLSEVLASVVAVVLSAFMTLLKKFNLTNE